MLTTGIDLVETERIKRSMKNPRFLRLVLGKTEFIQLEMRGFPVQSVAASFCAKEAFSKALGTGMRGFSLIEVELLREENGRPYLSLNGRALSIAKEKKLIFSVSVTHTKNYAAAVVIGEEIVHENIGL